MGEVWVRMIVFVGVWEGGVCVYLCMCACVYVESVCVCVCVRGGEGGGDRGEGRLE